MSIILGIDPGSRVTGYGVIRQVGRQLTYLGSGCIRTKVDDLPSRLKLIYAGVSEIITQFQPDYFAIEQVFMAKNADSALKLGQARGVAIVAAVNPGICRCLSTRHVRLSRRWWALVARRKASAAHGAYPAEAPCEPAGRRRGCAGHCDYPLSRQPECDANERLAAQSGARQVTIMTNQAGCLSSLFYYVGR